MSRLTASTALLLSLVGALAQTTGTDVDSSILALTATGTAPGGFSIPPLAQLTSGAATDSTVALYSTATAGASPTVSGAPALPSAVLTTANYPALDVTPPTDSDEVKAWLAAIDLSKVPAYNVTTGECSTSPSAITDGRCWWTCGGCTRETDITSCPDKNTFGLSYDDGPSPFTPLLLDYLDEVNVKSTFFLVGSRVLSRPEMVQTEYMAGHHLSVHTWSHSALTTLTNEQIVAELGWTQKVIRDVTGVTPNTFRPPYGDIDDRVRAVAAQMGLTPIIWSSMTSNGQAINFDTNDWKIPGGTASGASSYSTFEKILNEYAPTLDTGFIVLSHDIYQQTVDLAVGYVLPQIISNGTYTLKSIVSCLNKDLSEAYIETSSNQTSTQITAATGTQSTFFQPVVGTATGSEISATGTLTASSAANSATSGDSTSGSVSGSGSSAGSSAASSAASTGASTSGAGKATAVAGFVYGAVGMGAVALGMVMAA